MIHRIAAILVVLSALTSSSAAVAAPSVRQQLDGWLNAVDRTEAAFRAVSEELNRDPGRTYETGYQFFNRHHVVRDGKFKRIASYRSYAASLEQLNRLRLMSFPKNAPGRARVRLDRRRWNNIKSWLNESYADWKVFDEAKTSKQKFRREVWVVDIGKRWHAVQQLLRRARTELDRRRRRLLGSDKLEVFIRTGSDDLRGGRDNVDVTLHFAGGGKVQRKNANRSARWGNESSKKLTFTLPKALRDKKLERIEFYVHLRGGMNGDNWNLKQVHVRNTFRVHFPHVAERKKRIHRFTSKAKRYQLRMLP